MRRSSASSEPRAGSRDAGRFVSAPTGLNAPSSKGPLLVALPGFERLGQMLAGLETAVPEVERFENGEVEIRLGAPVADRDCLLLGTVAPPGDRLVELLLCADTLLRNGGRSLNAALPYLAYARQDRPEAGVSLAAAWLGRMLAGAGVEGVITIDIHSEEARKLIGLPVVSLSPAQLFASKLAGTVRADAVVVAPDQGARARARAAADALGVDRPVAWLEKQREPGGVTHTRVVGEVARSAVVVDDILDTGGTLVSCCRRLRSLGVEELALAVTHGLFTGSGWRELGDLGVSALHTTDSVPGARAMASELVRVHSVAPLLAGAINRGLRGFPEDRPWG
jgi:ribose-phosphate pyrophosphokinase